jgi:hypothetical protein
MTSDYFIGLDPGGEGTFGWALAVRKENRPLNLLDAGCSSNARTAVDDVLSALPSDGTVRGAGIDAPLYWTPTGVRRADAIVREVLSARGAPSAGGTVQQLNSLSGACLVQGPAAAILLRQRFPSLLITETHPKALLWHIGIASRERPVKTVRLSQASQLIQAPGTFDNEHVRDAALSCAVALALHDQVSGWQDLSLAETEVLPIVPGGVCYWMPIEAT